MSHIQRIFGGTQQRIKKPPVLFGNVCFQVLIKWIIQFPLHDVECWVCYRVSGDRTGTKNSGVITPCAGSTAESPIRDLFFIRFVNHQKGSTWAHKAISPLQLTARKASSAPLSSIITVKFAIKPAPLPFLCTCLQHFFNYLCWLF